METYRSGHNELDSKSSCPKGHVGSNPTVSAMKGWQKRCQPFFLSIHAGLRAFGRKIRKTVLPWMSKTWSEAKPHERGFRLIFQVGGPAFLRFTPFFPVVGCVEVSDSFIDRLTNTSKGNFKPSRYKGVVRPFLEPPRQAAGKVFCSDSSLPPSLTLSP